MLTITTLSTFVWMASTSYLMLSCACIQQDHDEKYWYDRVITEFQQKAGIEMDKNAKPVSHITVRTFSSRRHEGAVSFFIKLKYFTSNTLNFLFESDEYKWPELHRWRISLRRLFLLFGVPCFTYITVVSYDKAAHFSSKAEFQSMISKFDLDLKWPEEKIPLDDVFILYNNSQIMKRNGSVE